jgi:hypothetical protein
VGSALATRVAAPATVGSVALDPRFRAELSKAGNKTREWTARRDELIRLAHLDGASLREIAAAVGLSNPGVLRIVKRGAAATSKEEHRLEALEWVAEETARKLADEEDQ